MVKKYQDINLEIQASPKIIANPTKDSLPKIFKIKPAKNAQMTVIVPRILLRHPKYLPLLKRGIWSDIKLPHAGPGNAKNEDKSITNSINQNTLFSLKMSGTKRMGIYIKACKKTKIFIMRFLLFKCSATSADFNCNKEATKLGKAVNIPICAVVAFNAMAKGVIYCSVKPSIIDAKTPSNIENFRLCFSFPVFFILIVMLLYHN